MLALIDESTPTGPRGVHYVVSSAVVIEDIDACRERVAKVTSHRARPFHWHTEGVVAKAAMMECFSDLPVSLLTVVHYPVKAKQQHIARAAAMRHLATRLSSEGVTSVIIESRGFQDQEDKRTILQAQSDGLVSSTFFYEFRGKDEPLLWLADALAGIYSDAEMGTDPERLVTLNSVADILDVTRIDPERA